MNCTMYEQTISWEWYLSFRTSDRRQDSCESCTHSWIPYTALVCLSPWFKKWFFTQEWKVSLLNQLLCVKSIFGLTRETNCILVTDPWKYDRVWAWSHRQKNIMRRSFANKLLHTRSSCPLKTESASFPLNWRHGRWSRAREARHDLLGEIFLHFLESYV